MVFGAAAKVQSYTATRQVEAGPTLEALRRVRGEVADAKFKPAADAGAGGVPRPDPTRKFEAKGVEGNITQVVGGATEKPVPPPPKKIEPKGAPQEGGTTSSLLEAKRRARQQMEDKEKGQ
jgi:hypothetical protein